MYTVQRKTSCLAAWVPVVALLSLLTATPALAEGPETTIVPVMAPRVGPPPVPNSSVVDRSAIDHYLHSDEVQEQAVAAAEIMLEQELDGEPGILETETETGSGLTLFEPPDVCNDFNRRGQWRGTIWTDSYANWGTYAADDGYFQAKNVTFDREKSVGPGANFDRHQSSMKIASTQPYEAGVMSPPISVKAGKTVLVRVNYLIFNHGIDAESLDYASMGVIAALGKPASYVYGHRRGEWATMEQEVQAEGEQIVVMLQGHSPSALNSNIYFDNVQVFVDGRRVRNCRR